MERIIELLGQLAEKYFIFVLCVIFLSQILAVICAIVSRFLKEAETLPTPTEIIKSSPKYIVEKAQYEWAKDYLKNRQEK